MTKVLLVEDDNNLREIYEARLAAEGYEISTAKDGEDALAVAKQVKPDLIISDVMMPRISGFEMLDILRNTEGLKHTKIIMLTALGQAEDKTRADSLGADRYLVKSQVTLEDIVKAADELLNPNTTTAEQAPEVASTPETVPTASNFSPIAPPDVAAAAHQPETAQPAPAMPTVSANEPNDNPEAAVTSLPDTTVQPAVPAQPTPAANPVTPPAEQAAPPVQPAPATAPVDESATSDNSTDEPLIQMPPQPVGTDAAIATTTQAQSTSQENAAVAQQIENFVNTEQPAQPTPAANPVTPPAEQAAPPVQPAPATQTTNTDSANNNDEVIKTAIDDLAASSEPPTEPATAPATSTEAETNEDASEASSVAQVAGKKVISPINDLNADKTDLDALLAKEQAKENLENENGTTGTPVVGDATTPAPEASSAPQQPTSDAPTPPPGGVFMPNENGSANENAL
jgi:CheY-like chemotaxis protein